MKKPLSIKQQERIAKSVYQKLDAMGFIKLGNFRWIALSENMRLCIRGPFIHTPDHQSWDVQTWDDKKQNYPSIGMSGTTGIGSMWADRAKVFSLLFSKAFEVGYQLGRTTERGHTKVAIQPLLMILQNL